MKGAASVTETWGDRLAHRLTPGILHNARARRVKKRLLHGQDDDEDIVDEVYHHRVVYLPAVAEVLLAGLVVLWALYSDLDGVPLLLLVALALVLHAAFLSLQQFLDIFVITNVRVLRVSGLAQHQAGQHPALPDPRHHARPAAARPAPELWPLRLRVRGPRPGSAGHQVRAPSAAP